jgi:hypothetical protein
VAVLSSIDDWVKFMSSWPWYNFVMLVIAVASVLLNIVLSVLLFQRGKRERLPSYAMLSTSVIRDINSLEDLQVLYRGQQVESVTVTNLMFWNAGRETISDDVTLEPLTIRARVGCRILNAKKVQENNVPSKFDVIRNDDGSAEVRFRSVDQNQGVVVQVVHDGKSGSDLEVTGAFMRAPKLSRREIDASALAARRNVMALVVLMMVPYGLLLFQMLLTRNFSNVLAILSMILVMALYVLYAARRPVPKGLETFVEPLSLRERKRKTWVETIEEQLKKIRK